MSEGWSGRRRLHFIGIGGAGMSGLALVCAGWARPSAAATAPTPLIWSACARAGLDPAVGHDAANLPEGAEVVVSTAIGADNPELALARERGWSRSTAASCWPSSAPRSA